MARADITQGGMTQDEVIRRLSQGEGFNGQVPERIDTHISTIFLVGDDAYKLKRALATSYLDYTTLEKRRRFCEAEIATNQRTAPQLYLDVTPVRQSVDGDLIVGEGSGNPIEWLVHMRRFADGCLFDDLAEDGRLTSDILAALADEITAFHGIADVVEDIDASRRIGGVIDQVAHELEQNAAAVIEPALIDLFNELCRSAFTGLRQVIDRRGASGFVRRCHGDLHLRNVCLIDGRPVIFDAIEFSDDLNCVDVLFDLAFLVMDLDHRGLRADANVVFNRYLYRSGDTEDLVIFPLFLALRAGIRAHVSAMAAGTNSDGTSRYKLRQDANSYLRLGVKQFEAAPPNLIAVGGVSGSGKSTIARDVAPDFGCAPGALVLNSDLIRKKILGVEPLTRLTDTAYEEEINQAVYDEMMNVAQRALENGYSVVLDASFIDPDQRGKLPAIASQAGAMFEGFWLEATVAVLQDRLNQRVDDPSDATVSVLERQLGRDLGHISWHRIDATEPRNSISTLIRDHVIGHPDDDY